MQRLSYRTVVVLLVLVGLIVVQQHAAYAAFAQAGTIRLTDDPNEPGSEAVWQAPLPAQLDDDPNNPCDPPPERI
jgi:hypothetical protein